METLEDKVKNKISLFNALNISIQDRESSLVKLFSHLLLNDYNSLIVLSKEYQKPDLKDKVKRLKIYTKLLEKFCEEEAGDIDELVRETSGLDSLIKEILTLSKD